MSDETLQRRPEWMVSVKMSSERVTGVEMGNGDNQKGWYLADGATYTYIDGDEYENIFPYWDWRRIPGVTAYQTSEPLKQTGWLDKQNTQDFVGNVNDGHTGMTAMDFSRDGIRAKKAWIFTGDYVLCLGTAINADSGCVVTTSIEQNRTKSDLLYWNNNTWQKTSNQSFTGKPAARFFHHNTGYIIMDGHGTASVQQQTGNWNDIMSLYPPSMTAAGSVVSLYIDHGKDPIQATYQYLILPVITKEKLAAFDLSSINVLENTGKTQAVYLSSENIFLLSLYEAGSITLTPGITFKSNAPGLFLIKQKNNTFEVLASDPTHKQTSFTLSINGQDKTIPLPQDDFAGTVAKVDFN